jgi:hypothetical protein
VKFVTVDRPISAHFIPEVSISSFLKATKAASAIRSGVQILREVLLAFAHSLSMHSMLTIVFMQGLRAKREIVEKLLEQHSTETDPLQNMIAWNLDAFLSSYMRNVNPVLRRNPWHTRSYFFQMPRGGSSEIPSGCSSGTPGGPPWQPWFAMPVSLTRRGTPVTAFVIRSFNHIAGNIFWAKIPTVFRTTHGN